MIGSIKRGQLGAQRLEPTISQGGPLFFVSKAAEVWGVCPERQMPKLLALPSFFVCFLSVISNLPLGWILITL